MPPNPSVECCESWWNALSQTREKVRPLFSRNVAVFGTASDVGKSLTATAFCRLVADLGHRVAPFKAQNMSNNAAVAFDGGEIGRAQFVQALAARVPASVHHNPVLLKPTSDRASQVIVRGQVHSTAQASDYFRRNRELANAAFESLEALSSRHDVVIVEGAGSCAEVNLREREFVNFATAHRANARVVLVADIERGGVFAQVVGTLDLLNADDRARVCGVVINKFRGDPALFDDGVEFLEARTGIPVLGVVPFVPGLDIDGEDSLDVPPAFSGASTQAPIAVLAYPHLSNFSDFDALRLEDVEVHFVRRGRSLEGYGAVILPGSKAVRSDLDWLRLTGLDAELRRFVAAGGKVLGICGGMQMLGDQLCDPERVESNDTQFKGLGYLALSTVFERAKTVRRCRGSLIGEVGTLAERVGDVEGYEIHHGKSSHAYPPLFSLRDEACNEGGTFLDGVRTPRIWATYLHGLFDAPGARHAFLRWVYGEHVSGNASHRTEALDRAINRFANHVRTHIDWTTVCGWLR